MDVIVQDEIPLIIHRCARGTAGRIDRVYGQIGSGWADIAVHDDNIAVADRTGRLSEIDRPGLGSRRVSTAAVDERVA